MSRKYNFSSIHQIFSGGNKWIHSILNKTVGLVLPYVTRFGVEINRYKYKKLGCDTALIYVPNQTSCSLVKIIISKLPKMFVLTKSINNIQMIVKTKYIFERFDLRLRLVPLKLFFSNTMDCFGSVFFLSVSKIQRYIHKSHIAQFNILSNRIIEKIN